MTVEHSIIVGLDDINKVIFECRQCSTRVSMLPDDVRIPQKCPNGNCVSPDWIFQHPAQIKSDYEATTAAYMNFVHSVGYIRKNKNGSSFKVLLEFKEYSDDSEMQS